MQIPAWFAKLKRAPERIGIDVSGTGMRAVRLRRAGGRALSLAGKGYADIDPFNPSMADAERIKAFLGDVGGGMRTVALSIEDPSLIVQRMSLAPMPERDLMETIRWGFRDQTSLPVEKLAVGYTLIDEPAEGSQRLLMAYAVSRDAIDRHRFLAKTLDCHIVAIEPLPSALAAAIEANGAGNAGAYEAVVMLGEQVSYFIVMLSHTVIFARSMGTLGDNALVGIVTRNVGLEPRDARDVIDQWIAGIDFETGKISLDDQRRQALAMALSTFFSQLVIEVQRAIDAFCKACKHDKVDRMHICGKGAHYPGIAVHMEKSLGIPAVVFDPFGGLAHRGTIVSGEALPSLFAIAVGLAVP